MVNCPIVSSAWNDLTFYEGISLGVKGDEQNEFYSHNCEIDDFCNTNNYKNRVNPTSLCAVGNWRIPNLTQLKSLNYCSNSETLGQTCTGDFQYPTIPPEFFPHTKVAEHWTASELESNPPFAWFVTFKYGYESGDYKRYDKSVRLVAIGLDFSPVEWHQGDVGTLSALRLMCQRPPSCLPIRNSNLED